MFTAKVNSIFEIPSKKSSSEKSSSNAFVDNMLKSSAETYSGNGSLKYSTTGNDFLDQFGSVSNYREIRTFDEISNDMSLLYSIDKQKAISMIMYIRMITRKVKFFDGTETTEVQKGQGLKHEAISRMLWIAINDEKNFWNNIHLFISVGSWRDIITMMSYDIQFHGWENRRLNWDMFANLIMAGLENDSTSDLVKKYLPNIRTKKNCKTLESQADNVIAKFISSKIFGKSGDGSFVGSSYKEYRKMKTSGNAHEWQKLISKKLFDQINFGNIHGRALSLLVSGKFLKNNNLEDVYTEWIEKQPVAKYTGYVYELMAPVKNGYHNNILPAYRTHTINKQFMGLIKLAKKNSNTNTKFICALDTSSSMTSCGKGTKYSAYDIAKSIALYFSYLLEGQFHNYFFEFNDRACLKKWKGDTPVERLQNDRSEAYGSTNFLGIGNEFAKMRKIGVSESEFPNGIIAISDGEFNRGNAFRDTNVNQFKSILKNAGFSNDFVDNFTFVFFDIPNNYYRENSNTKFETYGDHNNVFYASGFDPAFITFLFGGSVKNVDGEKISIVPKSAEELMDIALSQEVMEKINIS